MAHVVFYKKPGCTNNTQQKTWLKAAGHTVECFSILKHPWRTDELRGYLRGNHPADWSNRTAPVIKSGVLDPDTFSEADALRAMIETSILIKRPLMKIGDIRLQGFDKQKIDHLIGLQASPGEEETVEKQDADNLIRCPQLDKRCDDK